VVSRVWDICSLQLSALASHWQDDCANFTPTPEENLNNQNTAPTTLSVNKHQANPSLSMNNYTPLVNRRNGKIKQLTLLSQHKLALNREKYTFFVLKSLDHLKNKKIAPSSV
jgi:hypothetical protein